MPDIQSYSRAERLHVAIIGSGSGAFAAAIRASEAQARVTMIERNEIIGGTCVNVGCVPSKITLRATEARHTRARHPFHGIARDQEPIEQPAQLAQLRARVHEQRHNKYQKILDDNPDIELIRGEAHFEAGSALAVKSAAGHITHLSPDRILVTTGASPFIPAVPSLADTPYWTSTEALYAERVPEDLIVLGSSFVALVLAQAHRRLDASITLLARNTLLSRKEDGLQQVFETEGIDVRTHTRTEHVSRARGQFTLQLENGQINGDHLLVATGRHPNTADLALDRAGVETDGFGAIAVDERLRNSAEFIYSVGDCSTMPQLVYVAGAAGRRAVENITGGDARLDLSVMPEVIFTNPQIATVGLDKQRAGPRASPVFAGAWIWRTSPARSPASIRGDSSS